MQKEQEKEAENRKNMHIFKEDFSRSRRIKPRIEGHGRGDAGPVRPGKEAPRRNENFCMENADLPLT